MPTPRNIGPGAYSPAPIRSASIPISFKFKTPIPAPYSTPAPNAYSPVLPSGRPQFFGRKYTPAKPKESPGPGQYRPEDFNPNARRISLAFKTASAFSPSSVSPGPVYLPTDRQCANSSPKLSLRSRTNNLQDIHPHVSPDTYNPKFTKTEANKFSLIGGNRTTREPERTPGPGTYKVITEPKRSQTIGNRWRDKRRTEIMDQYSYNYKEGAKGKWAYSGVKLNSEQLYRPLAMQKIHEAMAYCEPLFE
ncbi:Conserved_hypothetical protein [Hexamita inflata]|uniref:Uncharacterized protein n=1 Tax=Hexamita inflata TaxID=28002 RepID=A0AA86NDP3_9EUKA|nr:Conserved hypothetical protein [Hexamita inflata]